HTSWPRDWSSDVCSSDLGAGVLLRGRDGVPETGNGYGSKQTNNGYDNHDFDERESGPVYCVHGIPDFLWFVSLCVAADWRAHRQIGRASCRERVELGWGA